VHNILKNNFPNIIGLSWQLEMFPFPSPFSWRFSLERRTHKFHLGGLENAVCSLSEIWGRAPAEIKVGAI